MPSKRILITGGRDWTDRSTIYWALARAWERLIEPGGGVVLIEGGCPTGADRIAKEIGQDNGLRIEEVPADWRTFGYAAGIYRNQVMVDRGADVCLAFPTGNSRGTWDCIRRAQAAGIPVHTFKERTPSK